MANSTIFSVELRDKDGNFRQYLTPYVTKIGWEWNRLGGCGNANLTLAMDYRKIIFNADDDIQIRVRDVAGGGTKLVYRGWVSDAKPLLKDTQSVSLVIKGYFDKLDRLLVHSSGTTLTYTSKTVSYIVDDIIDTFAVPNSEITKGTINAAGFTADTISFKATIKSVLKTLADLEGGVEYGVDEDLVFFWLDEDTDLRQKFFVGHNVKKYQRRTDASKLVNKYYLEGGLVTGSPYIRTKENTTSQTRYFLSEKIILNSAITTSSVADQYLDALLDINDSPRVVVTADIVNTNVRLEDTLPIGQIALYDGDYADKTYIWGTTANGGNNLIWGTTGNSGSGKQWGQIYKNQVDRIKYSLSDTEGRFNINLTLGDGILEASAFIRQMNAQLSELIQR